MKERKRGTKGGKVANSGKLSEMGIKLRLEEEGRGEAGERGGKVKHDQQGKSDREGRKEM